MGTKRQTIKIEFKAVDKATKQVRALKKQFRGITVPIKRVNRQFQRLQKELKGVQRLGRKAGKTLKNVGKKATMGLTVPIGFLGAAVLKTSADFEKGMNKVRAKLGDKATPEALKALTNQAKHLGATTQFSATQAANGMSFLAQAGWDAQQILSGMPGLLNLAASSEMDLARAADITSNVMGAFKIPAKEASRVADVFAAATSSANIDMEQLGETMQQIAPIAKKYGLSLEETTSAVGLLGNIGIQGSAAGTALKNAMLNLAGPSTKASKILKKLGIEVADSQGNMLGMQDVMTNIGKGISKLNKQSQLKVLKEVFGKRAIAGGSELLDQALAIGKDGKSSIERFTTALQKSNGRAKEMAEIMNSGAAGSVTKFRSALEGLFIAIGDSGILEVFTNIVTSITSFISELSKTNPTLLKWGTIILAMVAVIGPLLIALGMMVSSVSTLLPLIVTIVAWFSKFGLLKLIAASVGFLAKAFMFLGSKALVAVLGPLKAIGAFLLANPIVAAIAALAAIGLVVYKNWKEVKELFSALFSLDFEAASKAMGKIWDNIKGGVSGFFGFGGDEEQRKKPNEIGSEGKQLIKQSEISKKQLSQHSHTLEIPNAPQGTRIKSEGGMEFNIKHKTGQMGMAY